MEKESMILKEFGSFHIGGREFEISGKPVKDLLLSKGGVPALVDLNGVYQVEQMYVQYYLPENIHGKHPLLLWHGGGMTGATFETTPDGREGWLHYFIRKEWNVFVSDAVERGRSGWVPYQEVFQGKPFYRPKHDPFERFRIGNIHSGKEGYKMEVFTNSRFPVESYDNFTKQIVPRWTTTDSAVLAAYGQLINKLDSSVIIAHSQGATFAFQIAEKYPEKVKALVVIEPALGGEIQNANNLKDIPILAVYGDYFNMSPRWAKIRSKTFEYFKAIENSGGKVELIDLPEINIYGNSHLLMMDNNNLEISEMIQNWLEKKNLYEKKGIKIECLENYR
ncbi:alpha/beta fold hydrolase [Peribacillus butanolivorans]|uniref:alpha/beta fold hydrolase n=1 Tax=Peribacillus butanolivorans TaxID=421767 RepID=UPI00364910EF